jgi:ketosteroid isomerase-like protein
LLVDGNDLVVALGHEDGTIIESGKTYSTDWVHIFHLKGEKVFKFVEYVDVPSVLASFC